MFAKILKFFLQIILVLLAVPLMISILSLVAGVFGSIVAVITGRVDTD